MLEMYMTPKIGVIGRKLKLTRKLRIFLKHLDKSVVTIWGVSSQKSGYLVTICEQKSDPKTF